MKESRGRSDKSSEKEMSSGSFDGRKQDPNEWGMLYGLLQSGDPSGNGEIELSSAVGSSNGSHCDGICTVG